MTMKTPILQYKEETHDFGAAGLPAHPEPGIMWVFVLDGRVEAVDFRCPCGCGMTCYTPITKAGVNHPRPRWHFSRGPNGPTISPSIRYLGGCKAHFTITDGKVKVHEDSGK